MDHTLPIGMYILRSDLKSLTFVPGRLHFVIFTNFGTRVPLRFATQAHLIPALVLIRKGAPTQAALLPPPLLRLVEPPLRFRARGLLLTFAHRRHLVLPGARFKHRFFAMMISPVLGVTPCLMRSIQHGDSVVKI